MPYVRVLLAGVAALLLLGACATERASSAAAALPTARVLAAQYPAVVIVRDGARLPTARALPTPTRPPRPSATAAPTLPPLPTPTITPVPLPAVAAVDAPVPMIAPPSSASGAGAAPGTIPILMYHYVRVVDRSVDPLGYELSVTPDNFAQQLDWLQANGYATVRMDQLTQCLRGERACPAPAVALTFDDGYADAATTVLPLLKQHGFVATFYVVSGFVGQPGYMAWDEIRQLHAEGMEIGAHSVRHLNLTDLDSATVANEITQSRDAIAQALGAPVTSFCYPAGFYDAAIEEQVRAAGFANATTTRWDADWSDLMALPRRRITGDVNVGSFAWIAQR